MNVTEWKAHNDRPKWIQKNRDRIRDTTGKEPPHSLPKITRWVAKNKGAVTRILQETNE